MKDDATPSIEELLAHAQWMRGLARSVLDDEARAEDALQETWLRVIRQPPKEPRSVRAWLAAVVRNLATQFRRGEERRARRELASARPERTSSTLDVATRAELHRRVVSEVLALDEPYRSTILMRFFDRLPPRAIARDADVPVATVNTRLQRGLAQLRARLASLRGEGLWALAFPWGAMVMGVKTKVVAAAAIVVVACAGAWFLLGGGGHGNANANREIASAAAIAAATNDANPAASAPPTAPSRVADATRPRATLDEANRVVFLGTQRVRGRVVDEEHHAIPGARVALVLPGADSLVPNCHHESREELDGYGFADVALAPPTLRATTDELGGFELAKVRGGLPYTICVASDGFGERELAFGIGDRGGFASSGVLWFTNRSLTLLPEIVLTKVETLRVRVVDRGGRPVAGVQIWNADAHASGGWSRTWPKDRARTDVAGVVTLTPDPPVPQWIVARADDGREATLSTTEIAAKDDSGAIVMTLREGTPLDVLVKSARGELLPGMRVTVRYLDPSDHGNPLGREAITDDRGSARFKNLPRASRDLFVSVSGGCVNVTADGSDRPSVPPDVSEFVITVPMLERVIPVRFLDARSREPVAAMQALVVQSDLVELVDANGGMRDHAMPARGIGVLAADRTHGWLYLARPHSRVDPLGRREPELQPASFAVVVDAIGRARTRIGPFEPDELDATRPLDLALESGFFVEGRVRDAKGHAARDARVRVPGAGPGTAMANDVGSEYLACPIRAARCGEDGSFRVGPLASGEYDLVAAAPDHLERRVHLRIEHEDPSKLEIDLERGDFVRGSVRLDESEDPARFVVVARTRASYELPVTGLAEDGSFELGPFPHGEVRLLAATLDVADPGAPARWDGSHGRVAASELMKRLTHDDLTLDRAAEPPVVTLTLAGDVSDVELDPLRGDESAASVPLHGVLKEAAPDLEAIDVWCENVLQHESVVPTDGNQFTAHVVGNQRSLLAVRERFRPDASIWPDAAEQHWYVSGRIVTREDIRRGPIEVAIPRGSLTIQLTRPGGASFAAGSNFTLSFLSFPTDFRAPIVERMADFGNSIHLEIPVDGRLHFEGIPAGSYGLYLFLAGDRSAPRRALEVRSGGPTNLEVAADH